jgi:hypothetical protein
MAQRLHDDGRPDRRFVGLSSEAKVNFLEKAQRSDTLESLECVTALSFSPVAWYFAQAKPHKSGPHRRDGGEETGISTKMLSVRPSTKDTYTPKRSRTTALKINRPWPNYHPFSFFRTASRPFSTL